MSKVIRLNDSMRAMDALEQRIAAMERALAGDVASRITSLEAPVPYARVLRATTQSTTSGTQVAIGFDTVVEDAFGMWSADDPTRLTIVQAGIYLVGGWAPWSNASTVGQRAAWILRNGSNVEGQIAFQASTSASDIASVNVHAVMRVSAAEYFEFIVRQASGGALNINSVSGNRPAMWAVRIGS